METLHSRAVKTRGEPIFGGRSRRNRFCARLILAAALLVLSAPAGAHAALTVGYQADYWTIDAGDPGLRDRTLELMMGARAGWVRFMVRENDYAQRASAYQAAMSAARARGLRVMATLLRWRGGDGSQAPGATPAQWRAFARQAVDQLGPLVDAWGVMNEPNIAPFAPDSRVVCQLSTRADTGGSTRVDPAASTRVNDSPRGNARVRADTRRHRRARRGHDARVRTRRGARRVVGDRRSAHGRSPRVVQLGRAQRRRPSYRRVVRRGRADRRSPSHRRRRVGVPVVTPAGTTYVPTDSLQRACQAQALGAAYRAVYDDAARVLRAGDQTAVLIVGELAPGASNHEFMEAMFNAAPGPVDADVFAVHGYHIGTPDSEGEPGAYRITTIEATTAQVRAWHARGALTGDRTWITEIGYPPNLPADYLPRALDRAQAGRRRGIRDLRPRRPPGRSRRDLGHRRAGRDVHAASRVGTALELAGGVVTLSNSPARGAARSVVVEDDASVATRDIYVDHASGTKASRPQFDTRQASRAGATNVDSGARAPSRGVGNLVAFGAKRPPHRRLAWWRQATAVPKRRARARRLRVSGAFDGVDRADQRQRAGGKDPQRQHGGEQGGDQDRDERARGGKTNKHRRRRLTGVE